MKAIDFLEFVNTEAIENTKYIIYQHITQMDAVRVSLYKSKEYKIRKRRTSGNWAVVFDEITADEIAFQYNITPDAIVNVGTKEEAYIYKLS